jgi:hypothetical protein
LRFFQNHFRPFAIEKKNFAIIKICFSKQKKQTDQKQNTKSAQKKRDIRNGVVIVIIARL